MARDLRKLFEEEKKEERFVMNQGHEKRFMALLGKEMPKQKRHSKTGKLIGNIQTGNSYYKLKQVRKIARYYADKFKMETNNIYWTGTNKILPPEKLVMPILSHEPSFQPLYHIDLYITLGGKTKNGV